MLRITKSTIAPNPKEFDYWVDLSANANGGVTKYYDRGQWIQLQPTTPQKDHTAEIQTLTQQINGLSQQLADLITTVSALSERVNILESNTIDESKTNSK